MLAEQVPAWSQDRGLGGCLLSGASPGGHVGTTAVRVVLRSSLLSPPCRLWSVL